MATLTIVGSGTLVPHATRRSPGHWVRAGSARLLVDCGPGTLHGLAALGLDWKALSHVAITHFHHDHVSDLAALLYAFKYGQLPPRSDPLTVLGPPGTDAFLDRLAAALGSAVRDGGFPLHVVELAEGARATLAEGVVLSASPTPHTEESVCLRLETPEGALGFTGDTGPSDAVARFLAGCRVLVAECTYTDPPRNDMHLSPSGLARMATLAEPELLVLAHVLPLVEHDEAASAVGAAGFAGRAVGGADGMTIVVEADGPPQVRPQP